MIYKSHLLNNCIESMHEIMYRDKPCRCSLWLYYTHAYQYASLLHMIYFKVFASKYWLFCKWIVPASNVWLPYFYFLCAHLKKRDIEADILMKVLHVIYGSITIAGVGFQNLDLCLLLMASEQWGIFIVPHLLWHGNLVLAVSSKRLFN